MSETPKGSANSVTHPRDALLGIEHNPAHENSGEKSIFAFPQLDPSGRSGFTKLTLYCDDQPKAAMILPNADYIVNTFTWAKGKEYWEAFDTFNTVKQAAWRMEIRSLDPHELPPMTNFRSVSQQTEWRSATRAPDLQGTFPGGHQFGLTMVCDSSNGQLSCEITWFSSEAENLRLGTETGSFGLRVPNSNFPYEARRNTFTNP
jgi:hypothetical protein